MKVRQDESFMEAIAYLTLAAMLDQDSLRDSVLLPMMEYFESNAAMKAFFRSPFICVKVPPGGGRMRCELKVYDIS